MALKSTDNLNFEERLKRYKKKRTMIIVLIILFFSVLILYLLSRLSNKSYNSYDVISSIPKADSNTVSYLKYGKYLLKYSRDGASAIDGESGMIWNGSYNMREPAVDISGDYVAVADIGNKEICVFDGKGSMKKLEMTYSIASVSVAKQGVIAVLMEDGDTNVLELHNPYQSGDTLLYNQKFPAKRDGFGIGMDLSEDGTKLVLSVLYIANGSMGSKVTYYNFSDIGAGENYFMASFTYENTIVPKVSFLNNDTVAVIGDNVIELYTMRQKPELIYTIPLENEIKSIFSNEKYFGILIDNYDQDGKYKLLLYNLSGDVVLDKSIDFDYRKIIMSKEEIIFLSDLECTILKTNGKIKYRGKFDSNVSFIMPINNQNKYFIIDEADIMKIKLTEE